VHLTSPLLAFPEDAGRFAAPSTSRLVFGGCVNRRNIRKIPAFFFQNRVCQEVYHVLTRTVGRWLMAALSTVALAGVMTFAGGAAAAAGTNLQMPGANASYQQWEAWAAQQRASIQSVNWYSPGVYKVQFIPVVSNGIGKIPKGIVTDAVAIWGHGSPQQSDLRPIAGASATSVTPAISSYCSWMNGGGSSGNITDGVACNGTEDISGTYYNAAEYYDTSGYLLGHLELGFSSSGACSPSYAIVDSSDGSLSPGNYVRLVKDAGYGGTFTTTWWEKQATVYQSYGTVCYFEL
jgi:hypothetical protein